MLACAFLNYWGRTPGCLPKVYAYDSRPILGSVSGCIYSMYCIVLYLYIYIALLAVHTNQKRFQCERPREKRAIVAIV